MWNYPSSSVYTSYSSNPRATSVACEEEESAAGVPTTNYNHHGASTMAEESGAAECTTISTLSNDFSDDHASKYGAAVVKGNPLCARILPPSSVLTEEEEVQVVESTKESTRQPNKFEAIFQFRGIDFEKLQEKQLELNRLRTWKAPLTTAISKDKSYNLAIIGAEMWQRMIISYMQVDNSVTRRRPDRAQQPFFVTCPTEWDAYLKEEKGALIAQYQAESQGDDEVGPMRLRGRSSAQSSSLAKFSKNGINSRPSAFDRSTDATAYRNFSSSQGNSLFSVCFRAFGATLNGFTELFLPFIACAYLDRLYTSHHAAQATNTSSPTVFDSNERIVVPSGSNTASSVPQPRVFTDQLLRLAVVLLSLSAKMHTDLYVSLSYFCKYVKGVGESYNPSELAEVELRVLRGLDYNCHIPPTHLKDLLAIYLTDEERDYVSEALSWNA